MAEEYTHGNQISGVNEATNGGVGVHGEATTHETKDRGVFDNFLGKKEEEVIHGNALNVDEEKRGEEGGEKKKEGFLEKLHRSNSTSSSSSDEEEGGEGEEKKKKKKGLKEKIKEKIGGEKSEEVHEGGDGIHSSEPCAESGEHKKGFIENIKEKLHGHDEAHKKDDEPHHGVDVEETKEKKGIFEKIKEKLPGYHPAAKSEEDKEKESHAASTNY